MPKGPYELLADALDERDEARDALSKLVEWIIRGDNKAPGNPYGFPEVKKARELYDAWKEFPKSEDTKR